MADQENFEKDVLPMLSKNAKPEVRSMALQIFLGLTGTTDGCKFIASNDKYLEAIVNIAIGDQPGIVKDAYCALINLCTDEGVSWQILNLEASKNFVYTLIKYVITPGSIYADFVCSVLSNISRSERCSRIIVDEMVKERDEIGFDKLIEAFCKGNFNPTSTMHHIGPLLSNLTQVSGRYSWTIFNIEKICQYKLYSCLKMMDCDYRGRGVIL